MSFWEIVWLIVISFAFMAYLIVKGRGMGERRVREVEDLREQQDAYIQQVAGSGGPVEQIAQAKTMLDAGSITPAEYERLKEKALA